MSSAILSALDEAQTAAIAASLCGLSISAASFLLNLARTQADKAKEKGEVWERAKSAIASATSPTDKITRERNAALDKAIFLDQKSVADGAASAMNMLLLAFVFFAIDLIERLALDPIVDKTMLADAVKAAGTAYEQWLPVDALLSSALLGIGIALLSRSAWEIFKVVPKLG